MPTPSYDELSDAPAYDELSDAPVAETLLPRPATDDPFANPPDWMTPGLPKPKKPYEEWTVEDWRKDRAQWDKRAKLEAERGVPVDKSFLDTISEPIAEAQEGLIDPATAERMVRFSAPAATSLLPGVTKSLAETASGFTSPMNMLMLGAGGELAAIPKLGAAAARGVAGGFAVDMARHLPELWQATQQAETPEEKQKAWTDLALNAGMAGLAGVGTVMPAPRAPAPIPPRIIESIAKADAIGLNKSAQALADTVKREPPRGAEIVELPSLAPDAFKAGDAVDFSDAGAQLRGRIVSTGADFVIVEDVNGNRTRVSGRQTIPVTKDVSQPLETPIEKGIQDAQSPLEKPAEIKPVEEVTTIQEQPSLPPEPARAQGGAEGQVLLADQVAAMTGKEFFDWSVTEKAKDPTTNVTKASGAVGEAMKSPEGIRKLVELERVAEKEANDALLREDAENYGHLANKKVFFTEALETATGTPPSRVKTTADIQRLKVVREQALESVERTKARAEAATSAAKAQPELPGTQLGAAESRLATVVNQSIEQAPSVVRQGVSPAATMRPTDVVLGAPDLRSISPAVEARWQAAVKGTEGIIDKVKQHADEAWKSITREYADLPPREFPAEIDVLRRQRAAPNASARTTVDVLKGITHNMGQKQYGVFNRVALLEDLVKDVESGKYAAGNDLPFGYKDAGELTADLNKFRAVAEATPQIKAALERRQEFMDSMRSTLVERGFLPESVLQDPRYFHHQVLMYMAEKNAPTGSRSFRDWFSGWQKKRTGSSKDYNRQYVEAEAEVLSDAFNKIANQDLIGEMQGIADIAAQLKEVHGTEWRQHIPKKYTTWQPKRGNVFFQVQTVAERVMDRYLNGLGDILPSEFKEALAVGGRRQEWVIPKSLAKVLDNIAPRPDNWIGELATTMHRSWRKYILLNPLRAAKYNLNNLSGDLDFLFAAQPKIFKEFKAAAPDMWGFHVKGKSAVGDIKEAMQDGVIGSGWRASELPDIARSDYFNWLTGEKPKLVDRYWNWIGKRTDAREDTGRLASYRFAKKEWEADRPFYGASVPADVNALATPRLKAAKVAREILIDYGRGTEFSNFMREKIAPFFKWMEGNFVRYQQLIKNIPEHEGAGPRVAGAVGKKAATLTARMAAAYGIINLWNHLFFQKEEEDLGEGRNQLHLILGRDDQGNVQTIRFQGALSDLLGWVGGEDLPQDVKDLVSGKASVGDKMEDAYEAGISRAVNASLPFPKTAAEIGLGRSFYPNALQPRPVRDKAEHAAGLFSLKPVYQWLAGKPHKPLRKELASLITYTTDPGEAAYNTTRHMAGEWLEENGEERANVIPGKRSNALYYYKQALRYKDQGMAQKFLDEYNRLGGKREGLAQSIRASAPLSMLGSNRQAFLDSLSPQEREAVRRGEEWYRRVYAQPNPNPNP